MHSTIVTETTEIQLALLFVYKCFNRRLILQTINYQTSEQCSADNENGERQTQQRAGV